MSKVFDTLLLLALPASGKSEVRTFLTARNPQAFHMGPTVQLDDYPYVHLQLLLDEALQAQGLPRAYHHLDPEGQRNGPFMEPRELGALVELLNDDYQEILDKKASQAADPAYDLLRRLDDASERVGASRKFNRLSPPALEKLRVAIADEAQALYADKRRQIESMVPGRTVVIEFARGGPVVDKMPLPEGYGYQGTLRHLSPQLLGRSCVLYIRVDPEESRRKNRARARPDGHGSILFHGTPESVMNQEYGACDMMYLVEQSDRPGTLRVGRDGQVFHLPVAVFDNRTDLTTFARKPEAEWTDAEVHAIEGGLRQACDQLWASWKQGRE
ncbi:MAG: hypothetical protein ABIJ09_05080 [Pseudomonadota bacterium]